MQVENVPKIRPTVGDKKLYSKYSPIHILLFQSFGGQIFILGHAPLKTIHRKIIKFILIAANFYVNFQALPSKVIFSVFH